MFSLLDETAACNVADDISNVGTEYLRCNSPAAMSGSSHPAGDDELTLNAEPSKQHIAMPSNPMDVTRCASRRKSTRSNLPLKPRL